MQNKVLYYEIFNSLKLVKKMFKVMIIRVVNKFYCVSRKIYLKK